MGWLAQVLPWRHLPPTPPVGLSVVSDVLLNSQPLVTLFPIFLYLSRCLSLYVKWILSSFLPHSFLVKFLSQFLSQYLPCKVSSGHTMRLIATRGPLAPVWYLPPNEKPCVSLINYNVLRWRLQISWAFSGWELSISQLNDFVKLEM